MFVKSKIVARDLQNGTFDISPEICSKKTIKSGGVGACTFIPLNLYLFTDRAFIFFSWISHIKNDIAKRLFTNELQCSSILMFDLKTARKICPTRYQCIKLFLLVVISFCCWHLGKYTMWHKKKVFPQLYSKYENISKVLLWVQFR